MRTWPGLVILALFGMGALGQAQTPPAQFPPPPLRPLWQPEQARPIRQWQVTGPTMEQLDQLPQAAWSSFTSWQDQVSLPAPAGPAPAPAAHRFAAATLTSAAAREALVSIGSGSGYRLWLNGAPVGDGPGGPAFYPDAWRHPVHLNAGANRLVIELRTAGTANFSVRLLEPGTVLPPPRAIAPALLRVDGDALEILTDAAGPRAGLRLHVAALGPGGAVLGETDAPWGEQARLPTGGWPEGPLEIHLTGNDQWGERVFAWLRWYKGDWHPAAARLAAEAAAIPVNPPQGTYAEGEHIRFLAALIADQPDNADRAWGVLLEREEMRLGNAERADGFVRLAWIDGVDGSPQFCRAYLPADYVRDLAATGTSERRWPMMVNLHGWNPDNPVLTRWWDADRRHVAEAERYGVIWVEPHGRGNVEWREAGEDDVRRCLSEAQNQLGADPDRTYLTGLSMGGAGTWSIASHNPGLFAAIAPVFGGWDYRLVGRGGWNDAEATLPVERWHQENQSSFTGVESLNATPILVTHGDEDRSVPVIHSRYIVSMLARWGYDISYDEIPGRGHEELYARDRIVPWLLAHRRPAPPRVARVRAMSLRDANAYWLQVMEYERPLEAIEARAEALEPGVIRLDTRNVAAVTLTLPEALRGPGPEARLIWNGREQRLTIYRDGLVEARLAPAPRGDRKGPFSPGGMSDIFRTPFAIVHGPGAAERAAAERIAAIWRGSQHVDPRLVLDSETGLDSLRGFSILLVGGPRENALTRELAASLPMRVDPGGVTLLGRRFAAPDSVGQMIRPRPDMPGNYLLLVAAASPAAMARWDANSLFNAPYGSPAQPLDWAVGAVTGGPALRPGLDPSRNWVASGVFGADWRLDPRWVFTTPR
jgi:dienelactone hydrolase